MMLDGNSANCPREADDTIGAPSRLGPAPPPIAAGSPVRSFWCGGFEGADHRNVDGDPLDMVALTGHAEHFDADYQRLTECGLYAARESIGWRIAEPRGDGRFDFSRAIGFARSARKRGVQLLWTLMHYGVPPGVSVLDDAFFERFIDFAAAAARALRPHMEHAPVYTPMNEISYFAWAVCESNFMHPHVGERTDPRYMPMPDGFEVKQRLVRATLAAMAAIRAEDPRARFMHIDPLVHVVPPRGATPEQVDEALRFREYQWQALDMLAGRLAPQLGGSDDSLDLIGVNHYRTAQWEFGSGQTLAWRPDDCRRLPLSELLRETWARYRRPLFVAETGDVGEGRAFWLDEIAGEVHRARAQGVDVQGVCLYPIIDRPDWNDTADWHRSGLWDAAPSPVLGPSAPPDAAVAPPFPGRHLALAYAEALRRHVARFEAFDRSDLAHRSGLSRSGPSPCPIPRPSGARTMQTLLVFSHLRWNFVFQRPQHLLTRLAAHYNVVVVEEPVQDTCAAVLKAQTVAPGITVLRPHTSITALGFHDDQISMLHPLLAEYLETHRIDDYVVWLYTPMALPLVAPLHPRALVYDCMDELAAFLGAPRQLRQREAALLKSADAIFTGGPSLYEAKRELGAHVLCLPSSVDAKHFAPAGADGSAEPARCTDLLQSGIGGPRLGFFGVVDERMDLALIARLADASPHWQVVMVGPVVKIDSAHLPQRANLHWLGQQPYELLPGLVESWQVCLLPFALNDATRFISPTKTLEYMAAGKPVVSTAIHDVAVLYGEVVRIATDHDEFIAACRDALAETDEAAADRRRAMAEQVAGGSWDETAERVHVAIEQAIARVDSRPDSVASRRRAIERARDSHQQPPAANGI